jgi:hypothetical protein
MFSFYVKLSLDCFHVTRDVLFHRTELVGNEDGDVTEGYMVSDGSWTGVYGLLQRHEVELAYMPITMTSSRIDAMDFTVPLMEMRYWLQTVVHS